MPNIEAVAEADQGRVLRVPTRWLGLIVLIVIVFATVATAYGYSQRSYSATAEVQLADPLALSLAGSSSASSNQVAQTVANETQILQSYPIEVAAQKLLSDSSAKASFASVTGANIVDVTASDKSAAKAAAIANGYGNAYINQRRTDLGGAVKEAQAQIQGQINAVQAQIKPLDAILAAAANASSTQLQLITTQVEPQRAALLSEQQALQTQLNNLSVTPILSDADPRMAAAATPPTSSSKSTMILDGAGGLLLGLLIGVALSLLLEARLGKVRGPKDARFGGVTTPPVAVVGPTGRGKATLAQVTESYRRLAATLMQRATPGVTPVYVVASAGKTVRSSEAIADLGRAVANLGWPVTVVDAELDGPTLEKEFGVPLKPGLADLLSDKFLSPELPSRPRVGPDKQVLLVPAGEVSDVAREAFLGPRLTRVINGLSAQSKMTLIRTANRDSLATATLTGVAEAVVVVAVMRRTRRRELEESVRGFTSAGVTVAAILLLSAERPIGSQAALEARSADLAAAQS